MTGNTASGASFPSHATVVRAHSEYESLDFGVEEILLDRRSSRYLGLNPAGQFIFSLLSEPRTIADVVGFVVEHYAIKEEQARRDVKKFLTMMSSLGLVEIIDS